MKVTESLNSSYKKNRSPKQKLTENQDIAAISFFLEGGENSIPEIANRLGVKWWHVDTVINNYLRNKKEQEYIIFESKLNKL